MIFHSTRLGLRFGDRVTHVNGTLMDVKADLQQLDEDLTNKFDVCDCPCCAFSESIKNVAYSARVSLQVQVDLSETPLFHPHNVKVVEHLDDLGMTISERGEITHVTPGSPAHAAGVVIDRSIIQVRAAESLLCDGYMPLLINDSWSSWVCSVGGNRHLWEISVTSCEPL